MRYRVMLLGLAVPAMLLAQAFDSRSLAQDRSREQPLPRFRAGANLVRVDAYVSKDQVALLDLKSDDFLLFEDDKPQQIENFQLVEARRPNPQSERRDPTNVRDMNQQVEDAARVFTLFFDRLHVQVGGSYRARKPIIDVLDRVIGSDDMVGIMTPDMSPGSITYSHRTDSIERAVTTTWHWGQRDSLADASPEEQALHSCYGFDPALVNELIGRLREQHTLDALSALVSHLEVMRPERKFVMVFTEGWPLYRSNQALTRVLGGRVPGPEGVGVDPRTGSLRRPGAIDPKTGTQGTESCERQRTMLAYIDHEVDFRALLQRANRANVSFYPIDARGLVVFDTPIQWGVPPSVDAAWLNNRYGNLRMMAEQTDGEAVLNTNDTSSAMQKVFADIGSYYLLSYYSTNQKLDGRFRRIRVEVKRDDATVRARPGYLAPTEAEARAAGAAIERAGAARNTPPPTVTRALDALAPARGNLPMRVQAIGGRNNIRAIVEIDPATAKQPEWLSGGTLRLTIEPERSTGASAAGAAQTMTLAVDPGQRSIIINGSERPLTAGRYSVRAELTPRNGRIPLQVTTFVTVPADAVEVGTGLLASRRGPSTGLAYIGTADPRFRRTERIRLEVPLAGDGFTATGRVLTREGHPTAINVPFTTRIDEATRQQFGIADVTLAPLAAGEYVMELVLVKGGKTETVSYGFRIVP